MPNFDKNICHNFLSFSFNIFRLKYTSNKYWLKKKSSITLNGYIIFMIISILWECIIHWNWRYYASMKKCVVFIPVS